MRRLAMFSAAALAFASAHIASAEPGGTGFLCGFVSVVDNTGEPGAQTGEIDGGPITPADLDAPPGPVTGTIELICTIQVGPTGATHAGPAAAPAVSSGASNGAAVIPPTPLNYVAPTGSSVYLCSEVVLGGTDHYYYDDVAGAFSTSNSVPCGESISQEVCTPPEVPQRLCL